MDDRARRRCLRPDREASRYRFYDILNLLVGDQTPCSFIRRLRATDGLPPSDGTKMTSCLIQRLAVTPCTGPKASKLVLPPLRSARLPSPEAEPSRRSSAAEKPSRFPHHLSHHNQTLTPPTPTMEFARRATAPVDADDGCGVPHPSPRGNTALLSPAVLIQSFCGRNNVGSYPLK